MIRANKLSSLAESFLTYKSFYALDTSETLVFADEVAGISKAINPFAYFKWEGKKVLYGGDAFVMEIGVAGLPGMDKILNNIGNFLLSKHDTGLHILEVKVTPYLSIYGNGKVIVPEAHHIIMRSALLSGRYKRYSKDNKALNLIRHLPLHLSEVSAIEISLLEGYESEYNAVIKVSTPLYLEDKPLLQASILHQTNAVEAILRLIAKGERNVITVGITTQNNTKIVEEEAKIQRSNFVVLALAKVDSVI